MKEGTREEAGSSDRMIERDRNRMGIDSILTTSVVPEVGVLATGEEELTNTGIFTGGTLGKPGECPKL